MHDRALYMLLAVLTAVLSPACGGSSSSSPDYRQVSGTVRYEDRLYGESGFIASPSVFKAVRFAEIDVVETGSHEILASGALDSRGTYTLLYALAPRSTAYLRVSAKTDASVAPAVEVTHPFDGIYAATKPIDQPVVDILITASETGGIGEAFNILDVLTAGAQFVQHLDPLKVHPSVSASWAPNGTNGTYYAQGGGITVLGNYNFDTDGYDDDVIWHEYGHFVADVFSVLQSPYTQHSLSDNTQDLRLSWSEGWADFFPLAVKRWLWQNNGATLSMQGMPDTASIYVDTAQQDTETLNWSWDFGKPPVGSTYFYASSETAIAKVLWDLSGSPALGLQPIWDVIASFNQSPPVSPMNLEAFWDRWLSLRSPAAAELSALKAVFAGRGIFYTDDAAEQDNIPAQAIAVPVPTTTSRYLYSSIVYPDADYVSFVVTPGDVSSNKVFSIFTNNLTNGADTYLTLYDSGLQKVSGMENDNYPPLTVSLSLPPNDAMTLASFLAFKPSVPGTYYVEAISSPNAPVSAGRYGTYTLNIQ